MTSRGLGSYLCNKDDPNNIVMSVDVTSFKCIIYTNLIVPGLIFDIGGNK